MATVNKETKTVTMYTLTMNEEEASLLRFILGESANCDITAELWGVLFRAEVPRSDKYRARINDHGVMHIEVKK